MNRRNDQGVQPKWVRKLRAELSIQTKFKNSDDAELLSVLKNTRLLSDNFDTVVSLDFPHFCSGATEGCGGPRGWCYTFQGFQSLGAHNLKVGLVDLFARRLPEAFAEKVASEVNALVNLGSLPYPNLRYSGSGEVVPEYIPALSAILKNGVRLWGFCRVPKVAKALRDIGASVIFSSDNTTSRKVIDEALSLQLPLAYTSVSVSDLPPHSTFVVFPLHRSGVVREVAKCDSTCPKVIEEFLHGNREKGSCQDRCIRCHKAD